MHYIILTLLVLLYMWAYSWRPTPLKGLVIAVCLVTPFWLAVYYIIKALLA